MASAEEADTAARYLREVMDTLTSEDMKKQGRLLDIESLLHELYHAAHLIHIVVSSFIPRDIYTRAKTISTIYDDIYDAINTRIKPIYDDGLLPALDEVLFYDQLRAEGCYQKPCILLARCSFERRTISKLRRALATLISMKELVNMFVFGENTGVQIPSVLLPDAQGSRVRYYATSTQPQVIVGRTKLIQDLVDGLLQSHQDRDRLLVLPIVGGPGIGKTILAQAVYNAQRVRASFDVQSWICVSEYFNLYHIFSELSETRRMNRKASTTLYELANLVWDALTGRRYLIVLDDVWNEDEEKWNCLLRTLPSSSGSRIILTTRIKAVASCVANIVPSNPPCFVKPLDQEASLSLLLQSIGHHQLSADSIDKLGALITEKCLGVPLLLRQVGGLLGVQEQTEVRWMKCLSVFHEFVDGALESAVLSYRHLPPYLQRCLLYCCSKFPSDHNYDAEELCNLLVTEGLIQSTTTHGPTSAVEWLLGECFYPVEPSEQYRMHGMLYLFAQQPHVKNLGSSFGKEKLFSSKQHLESEDLKVIVSQQKDLWSSDPQCDITEIPQLFREQVSHISGLSLRGFTIKKFPMYLELLVLRNLDLSSTDIETIPRSISEMEFLQTLKLRHCGRLRSMDEHVGNLVRLKELDLEGCTHLVELPNLRKLKRLGALNLSWTSIKEIPSSFGNLRSLHSLQLSHCKKLQNLQGNTFSKLVQLKRLNLEGCIDLVELPNLSKRLEDLNLSRTGIKKIPSSLGKLQSLHTLKLCYCKKLQNLNGNTVSKLVKLQELDLEGCNHLVELPRNLSKMKELVYLNVLKCSSLIKMPKGVSQLTSLEKLLGYSVSNNDGCKISELKSLPNLSMLCLEDLEKVSEIADVIAADLTVKEKLESLSLGWNADAKSTTPRAHSVLRHLRPHHGLRTLEIISYEEVELPSWIASPRDLNLNSLLVEVRLINLKACEKLPPLGLLPRLKIAEIVGAEAIRRVDGNFYGDSTGTFPCLEKLTFSRMPKLEVWGELHRKDVFPCLKEVVIIQCPQLALKVTLPSVKNLVLGMNTKKLYGSEGGLSAAVPQLNYLSVSFCEVFGASSDCMGLQGIRGLEKLEICGCDEMEDLPASLGTLSSLKSLTIDNCSKLETLPPWLNNLTSLQNLHLSGCPILRYISEVRSWPILRNISEGKTVHGDIEILDFQRFSAESSGTRTATRVDKGKEIMED